MKSAASSPEEYINNLPDERKEGMLKLRKTILENLPEGFEEQMSYGMIGFVVPFSKYPAGYHADPKLPLPFMNIASQKNYISLYHMGIYAKPDLLKWFLDEYPKYNKTKPDIGKGCIRFRKADQIPFALIGELTRKISMEKYIDHYKSVIKKH